MHFKTAMIALLFLGQTASAQQDACLFYPCHAVFQNVIDRQLADLQQQYYNYYGGGEPLYYPGQENYHYPAEHVWFEDPIPLSRLPESGLRKSSGDTPSEKKEEEEDSLVQTEVELAHVEKEIDQLNQASEREGANLKQLKAADTKARIEIAITQADTESLKAMEARPTQTKADRVFLDKVRPIVAERNRQMTRLRKQTQQAFREQERLRQELVSKPWPARAKEWAKDIVKKVDSLKREFLKRGDTTDDDIKNIAKLIEQNVRLQEQLERPEGPDQEAEHATKQQKEPPRRQIPHPKLMTVEKEYQHVQEKQRRAMRQAFKEQVRRAEQIAISTKLSDDITQQLNSLMDKKRQLESKLAQQKLNAELYNQKKDKRERVAQCLREQVQQKKETAVDLTRQLNEVANKIGRIQRTCQQQVSQKRKTWHAGCEALAKPNESKTDQLFEICLTSLRNAILDGALSGSGKTVKLDRIKLFANMKKKLNTDEQNFLAMVFTAHSETRGLYKSGALIGETTEEAKKKEIDRFQNVMKVIDNRLRLFKKRGHHEINAMDVVLSSRQFSPYNPRSKFERKKISYNFLQSLHYNSCHAPANKASMKRATRAYIRHKRDNGAPRPDNVYHFFARTIRPPGWSKSGRKVSSGFMNEDQHHVFLSHIKLGYKNDIAFLQLPWGVQQTVGYALLQEILQGSGRLHRLNPLRSSDGREETLTKVVLRLQEGHAPLVLPQPLATASGRDKPAGPPRSQRSRFATDMID